MTDNNIEIKKMTIKHTSVDAKNRRNGIGTVLVDHAMKALKDEGISKAALVVFSKNELGNSFW